MLVSCPVCGRERDDDGSSCPVCGPEEGEEIQLRPTVLSAGDAAGTLRTLAAGLLQSGQPMESMSVVQMWMEAEPEAGAPHAAMGDLLATMGRFAEAVQALDTAEALGFDEPDVRRLKADCERRIGGAPPRAPRAADELGPAATLAMQVAALEATGAGHERLERAHVLLGLLNLEKFRDATGEELGLPPDAVRALCEEIDRVAQVLRDLSATAVELRQRIRDELGPGGAPSGRGSIRRSDACRQAFRRAAEQGRGGPLAAVEVLAAVCDDPDAASERAFRHFGLDIQRVAISIRGRSVLKGLVVAVKRQHGVDLELSAEAETFLAQAGPGEGPRLILTPMAGLVLSGKLARHAAWRVVYDEGGVYLLPAEQAGTR